jgi:hypothetical protein
MNPIVLKDILLYAVRTWKGARSRVPDNQDRVRLVQLKEECTIKPRVHSKMVR